MGRGANITVVAPALSPRVASQSVTGGVDRENQWESFDNSVNAVSFGFVATAILISMFLFMAIFERFLRQRSTANAAISGRNPGGVELGKRSCPSPMMTFYRNGVSVLMPGEKIPTFMAHPVPAPCPREHFSRPILQHVTFPGPASSSQLET